MTVLLALTAGCSDSGATPHPPVTSGAQSMPPVPRSLDAAKYADNLCGLLEKGDLAELGFKGEPSLKPTGPDFSVPSCKAVGGPADGSLDLSLKGDLESLRAAYEDTSGKYGFRHAVELRAFPGVVRSQAVDYPGSCDVLVAIGKQQMLALTSLPGDSRGGAIAICGRLLTLAETLLRKLGA
ncbi:DUF3558 family protein [Kibdelosporangium phytohabitans]|nr:DUF3558 family protein [Kibdelosporangium phytohabitans]MBE1471759.1 hypothetical protein [Kibdelosporangium phytohabitans]